MNSNRILALTMVLTRFDECPQFTRSVYFTLQLFLTIFCKIVKQIPLNIIFQNNLHFPKYGYSRYKLCVATPGVLILGVRCRTRRTRGSRTWTTRCRPSSTSRTPTRARAGCTRRSRWSSTPTTAGTRTQQRSVGTRHRMSMNVSVNRRCDTFQMLVFRRPCA